MFNYKKKYYDLLEEIAEVNKENRLLRKACNKLIEENEELKREIDNDNIKRLLGDE